MYWIWGLVFCADCYIQTIPIERAEQSSTVGDYTAANAIDDNIYTFSFTSAAEATWLRVYFKNVLTVETVKIWKGKCFNTADCVYHVSVWDGDAKTPCGYYTVQNKTDANGYYVNEVVNCGGRRGDSVMLEQKNCKKYLLVSEINAYTTGKIRPRPSIVF